MKLSDLHIRKNGDLARVVATVHFEEKNEPAKEIFIETEAAFADDLAAHPHAFAVGCLIPALYFSERRLALEEAICPRLKEGLETVMAIMHHWTAGAFPAPDHRSAAVENRPLCRQNSPWGDLSLRRHGSAGRTQIAQGQLHALAPRLSARCIAGPWLRHRRGRRGGEPNTMCSNAPRPP